MHPLTCVKYGAAALALGQAQSVTVPRGAASEYRICVSIIISAYSTTLCAGPRPLYCMPYNYMYCLIASRGGNVLCTPSLWACAICICLAWLTSEKSSKIHYCIGSLNVGVALRVQHFNAFNFFIVTLIPPSTNQTEKKRCNIFNQ